MKYNVTIERVLTRGYEIEADTEEELLHKVEELQSSLMDDPAEMEDSGESWDYAVTDDEGRDIITWSK